MRVREGVEYDINGAADDRCGLKVCVLVDDEEQVHEVAAGSEMLCSDGEFPRKVSISEEDRRKPSTHPARHLGRPVQLGDL